MTDIRPFEEKDWEAVWQIMAPVFQAGETYPYSSDITEKEAYKAWIETPTATFVAVDQTDDILGTYYIRPNQPDRGGHVSNCGYIVAEHAHGRGIASEMCRHSQRQAVVLGFKSMQFNLVVSTNTYAVRLYQKLGFMVIGALPEAFRHPSLGYVDAFIMYKKLAT